MQFVLTVLLLCFAAASSAQAPQPRAEPQQTNTAQAERSVAPAAPPVQRVEIVNQAAEPRGYQDPCKGNEADRQSDLCAQWTAANGARDAAYYARLQLWAAGAGMIGLIATIALTLRAVKAARDSVTVAQDTAKRQLRAYVTAAGIEVHGLLPGGSPRYVVVIKNCGQTPAYRVRSVVWVRASTVGPDEFKMRGRGKTVVGSPSELAPGEAIPHWSVKKDSVITKAQFQEILTGKVTLIFAGVITYYDAFGRYRRTIFRRYVNPAKEFNEDTGFAGLFVCQRGNRSS